MHKVKRIQEVLNSLCSQGKVPIDQDLYTILQHWSGLEISGVYPTQYNKQTETLYCKCDSMHALTYQQYETVRIKNTLNQLVGYVMIKHVRIGFRH